MTWDSKSTWSQKSISTSCHSFPYFEAFMVEVSLVQCHPQDENVYLKFSNWNCFLITYMFFHRFRHFPSTFVKGLHVHPRPEEGPLVQVRRRKAHRQSHRFFLSACVAVWLLATLQISRNTTKSYTTKWNILQKSTFRKHQDVHWLSPWFDIIRLYFIDRIDLVVVY